MGKTGKPLISPLTAVSSPAFLFWKILQTLFWFIGIGLLIIMIFLPPLGVTLFWNVLIPVAPVLLVTGTGIWRNICPLATTAMIPNRLGISKKIKLYTNQQQTLQLLGLSGLLLIIPLRHVLFNTSGQATAIIIISLSVIAFSAGLIFESRSAWCSGLCPVHPVEKLYGSVVAFSLPNVQCNTCVKCTVPCPDSTKNLTPLALKSPKSKLFEHMLVGAFPGYIWGWFQVPDYTAAFALRNYYSVYAYPVSGGIITLLLYIILKKRFQNNKKLIMSLFAASAVSGYYWFRLPQLFGFSNLHSNGILVNLTGYLPVWSMSILNIAITAFFIWWMVIANKKYRSWSVRPAYSIE
jgi:hypothetical protein